MTESRRCQAFEKHHVSSTFRKKKDRCLQGSTNQISTAHKSCTDDHIHDLQCLSHARRIHR